MAEFMRESNMLAIMKSGSVSEKLNVLQNPAVTPKVLMLGVKDFNDDVKAMAAASRNVTDEVLDAALRSEKDIVQEAVVKNPEASTIILKKAFGIVKKANIRQLILLHPNVDSVIVDWAVKDAAPVVRAMATRCQILKARQQEELLKDRDPMVRISALQSHKATLLQRIKAMREDTHPTVRETAKELIEESKKTSRIKD